MTENELKQAKILLEADYNQFGVSNQITSWMGYPLEEFDKEMLLKLTTILVNENSRLHRLAYPDPIISTPVPPANPLQKRWWQ